MNDYVVRFGNDSGYVEHSDYMSKEQAEKFYNKIKLNIRATWKELLYEPLGKEEQSRSMQMNILVKVLKKYLHNLKSSVDKHK